MKARTGSLIKRSSGYYVSIMVEGKRIIRALKTPNGEPCKTLQEAHRAQTEFTKPFTLSNQADALEAIQRKLEDVQEELSPKPRIADSWQLYYVSRERPQSGDSTLKLYQSYTAVFVEWFKSNHPQTVCLEDVSKEQATAFLNYLQGKISPSTVNKYHAFMRLLFKTLVEDGHNPFQRLRFLQAEAVPHKPLSQEQIQAILGKSKGELQTLLLIGVYTALRLGDACQLLWECVDMDRGLITVTPHKTASRSRKQVAIPIHPMLRDRLGTLFRKSEYVMPGLAQNYRRSNGTVVYKIRALFKAAGIDTQENGHTTRSFHSLRFTMGSLLISNGFTLDAISQVLGHSSVNMTRHYSSITNEVREKAILSLPSIATATAIA